jgi:hypothetical protein
VAFLAHERALPVSTMEPLSDDDLRRLLAVADVRNWMSLVVLLESGR